MNKKDELLYVAMTMIAEEGLSNLSAAKLAKQSGISKSTVFHHFESMDAIPPLILDKLYKDIIDPVQHREYSNLKEYFIVLGESGLTDNPQHLIIYKAFATLYQASVHELKLRNIVNSCSTKFEDLITQRIKSYAPTITTADALEIAQLVSSTLDGMGLHYLIHENLETSRSNWYAFVDIIINKIESRGLAK